MKDQPSRSLEEGVSAQSGKRVLGWILGVVSLLLLVSLPVVFAIEFNTWTVLPGDGMFSFTPALEVTAETSSTITVRMVNVVGSNPAGSNLFHLHTSEEWMTDFDSSIPLTEQHRIAVPQASLAVTANTQLQALNGGCCASDEAVVADGTMHFAAILPGFVLAKVEVGTDPPYNVTVTSIAAAVDYIGTDYGSYSGGEWVQGYNLGNNSIDTYTDDGAGFVLKNQRTADDPFDGSFWDTTGDPNDQRIYTLSTLGGAAVLSGVDLPSGASVISSQVGTIPPIPNGEFYSQRIDLATDFRFPDGSVGDAVVFNVNGLDTNRIGMTGPVDLGSTSFIQVVDSSDSAQEPQGLAFVDNAVLSQRADTANGEVDVQRFDFHDLSGPPVTITDTIPVASEWNRSTPLRLSTPNGGGVQTPILPVYFPVILKGSAHYGTLTLPLFIDDFETGDLRLWNNSVP